MTTKMDVYANLSLDTLMLCDMLRGFLNIWNME